MLALIKWGLPIAFLNKTLYKAAVIDEKIISRIPLIEVFFISWFNVIMRIPPILKATDNIFKKFIFSLRIINDNNATNAGHELNIAVTIELNFILEWDYFI